MRTAVGVTYTETGTRPAVVSVHGLLVNANLWRKVVPEVAKAGVRCIAPNWPLGAHQLPMAPDADLTPPGVAKLIADFLTELDLTDVTIVANDTGGALTQILMANHPERIGRVVLTPCDAFEDFFPPPFDKLPKLARLPGAMWLGSRHRERRQQLHPRGGRGADRVRQAGPARPSRRRPHLRTPAVRTPGDNLA